MKKSVKPVPIENAFLSTNNCINLDPHKIVQASSDSITHCPINRPGEKVTARIIQMNLNDNAYVSEMYVGNPP